MPLITQTETETQAFVKMGDARPDLWMVLARYQEYGWSVPSKIANRLPCTTEQAAKDLALLLPAGWDRIVIVKIKGES